MTLISKDISKAVALLEQEKLVAIPTETVYGLAGNIYSSTAIRSIFEIKQRPLFNPLIVHIHDIQQAEELTTSFPEKARQLAKNFWPGSLTLILPKSEKIPYIITAGKDTVGIRVPDHPVTLELLKQLNFPIAAPSANPYSRISPTKPQHVADYFGDELEMVLDGGDCKNGIESTIVGFENGEPVIYRLGSISQEDIEAVIGKVIVYTKDNSAPIAPGMVARHYAPRTKTILVDDVEKAITENQEKQLGVLLHQPLEISNRAVKRIYLTLKNDFHEAANKLYASLHELDQLELDLIIAQKFPDAGLGKSLNDRLSRATK